MADAPPGLRVLHLDSGRSWRGGQQQVLHLHRGLLARGVESHLACQRGGELLRRAAAERLPVSGLPMRGEFDLFSAVSAALLARKLGATLLHAHSGHAHTVALLAAKLARPRALIATRRVDFVPSRHPLNRWKYLGVDRLVTVSRAIAEIMAAYGVPPERLRVVHSGVDTARAAPGEGARVRAELGIGLEEKLVGNVGHLADHKGQRYLIDAVPRVAARFPGARFAVVGDGELRKALEAQAAALGLGRRLVFTGFRTDVKAVLDALDVFVMPSHLEGLGTVVAEALAAGKPVVGTRAGGIPEMIDEGVEGLLVRPRDPGALADAVCRLLEDPELANRLGEAGRRRVEREFSTESMVRGNLRVYEECLR